VAAGSAHLVSAFRQGLNEAGFVEGQNVAVEYRWADDQDDRIPGMVAELVRRQEQPCPRKVTLARSRLARLLRPAAVSRCSGPSVFSQIASARSKSGRAPAKSPGFSSRYARMLRVVAVLGLSARARRVAAPLAGLDVLTDHVAF
jgi:hypothetical protein